MEKIKIDKEKKIYLFSIDLEDLIHPNLDTAEERNRFPKIVEKYLRLLGDRKYKCTFFTVGRVADKYPSLIKDIYLEGHEIACHSFNHKSLDTITVDEFRFDLTKNIESIIRAGAECPIGYRAPYFSLNEKTIWVYSLLKEFHFKYSSSVLPAKNPQYGWEKFDKKLSNIEGIVEIPISTAKVFIPDIPFAGGAYFKLLPEFYIKNIFRTYLKNSNFISGYFHPYDIDYEQQKVKLVTPKNIPFSNFILYSKRRGLLKKIESILDDLDLNILTYKDYYGIMTDSN